MTFSDASTVLNKLRGETPARVRYPRLLGASELGPDTSNASFRAAALIWPSARPSFGPRRREEAGSGHRTAKGRKWGYSCSENAANRNAIPAP